MASASIRFFMKDADAVKDADADQCKRTFSLSVMTRYGASLVDSNCDSYSTSVAALLYSMQHTVVLGRVITALDCITTPMTYKLLRYICHAAFIFIYSASCDIEILRFCIWKKLHSV